MEAAAAVVGLDLSPLACRPRGSTEHATCESFSWISVLNLRFSIFHSDNAHGRVFANELPDNNQVTVQSCISSCSSQGYSLAGLEYSGEH